MFESNNLSRRPGGFRQSESPREQNGQFNGGHKRQRFVRGAEKVEGRPAFGEHNQRPRFNPNSTDRPAYGERQQRPAFGDRQQRPVNRPKPQRNAGVYSQKKRIEYAKRIEDPTKPIRLNKYLVRHARGLHACRAV